MRLENKDMDCRWVLKDPQGQVERTFLDNNEIGLVYISLSVFEWSKDKNKDLRSKDKDLEKDLRSEVKEKDKNIEDSTFLEDSKSETLLCW